MAEVRICRCGPRSSPPPARLDGQPLAAESLAEGIRMRRFREVPNRGMGAIVTTLVGCGLGAPAMCQDRKSYKFKE
jgi:hypothetical protein